MPCPPTLTPISACPPFLFKLCHGDPWIRNKSGKQIYPSPSKLILRWQKISVSLHEIRALGLKENVQFCVAFWTPTSHMAAVSRCQCRGFMSEKLSRKRRKKRGITWQSLCSIFYLCVHTQTRLLNTQTFILLMPPELFLVFGGLSLLSFSSCATRVLSLLSWK